MRALIVKEPWVSLILNGQKTWEIRGKSCRVRERIGLIRAGSGTVVGTVEVVDSIGPLSRADLAANEDKHRVSSAKLDGVSYKETHAWVLANPRKFTAPVPYHHPSGAQMWVTIPDLSNDGR